MKGIDAEYIGPPSRNPAFKFAELKPYSDNGFDALLGQLSRWIQRGLRGKTQLWFYDEAGIIGSSGLNY
jgi:hypothetical protein